MKEVADALPDVIRIEPASACNLACIHCPTGIMKSKGGIMSEDTFNILMENFGNKVPRVAVMYHGGEPLLCKNLWERVARLKEIGVKFIKTNTNGMLLNDDTAKKLIYSGLDLLVVSIDGQSPEENDLIRRGSNCYAVMDNTKRVLELRRELNSDTPSVSILNVQFGSGKPNVPLFLLNAFKDSLSYLSMYATSRAGYKIDGFLPFHKTRNNHCSFLSETMTVRWNGDVVPCCHDMTSGYVMGNIHKSSLEDIRKGELFKIISEGIQSGHPVKLCEECFGKQKETQQLARR